MHTQNIEKKDKLNYVQNSKLNKQLQSMKNSSKKRAVISIMLYAYYILIEWKSTTVYKKINENYKHLK